VKLQTKDYQTQGTFPIVDQGQELIAGWTDSSDGLISSPLPVVIFGDHTRIFKFIDFPFVRGADGTQILKPRPDINPLYFYYACKAIDLPSRGYNRHFTILKEKTIPIPPWDEQLQIAQVLHHIDQEQELLKSKSVAIAKLSLALLRRLMSRELSVASLDLSALSLPPAGGRAG
jgi:type I restriction enzyme S subunit